MDRHKDRRKHHVRIQFQGIRYHLRFLPDAETAGLAYDAAAWLLFGEFARCDYPDRETPQSMTEAFTRRLKKGGLEVGRAGGCCLCKEVTTAKRGKTRIQNYSG